jgi:hypothetical protein
MDLKYLTDTQKEKTLSELNKLNDILLKKIDRYDI